MSSLGLESCSLRTHLVDFRKRESPTRELMDRRLPFLSNLSKELRMWSWGRKTASYIFFISTKTIAFITSPKGFIPMNFKACISIISCLLFV